MLPNALAALLCWQTPLLCMLSLGAQTPAPTPPEVPAPSVPAQAVLEPGVLPAETTPEARAAWTALVTAMRPQTDAAGATAITAFDLTIKTRLTTQVEGGGSQKNDVQLRYRYLAPGWVRTTLADSKVERMRGPDGDWLWDPVKHDVVQLAGQEFAQDRRELSQTLSIARNYVALAEPARLRIARLELLAAPPDCLPLFDPAGEAPPKDCALLRAASLQWISITSPDFQVVEPVRGAGLPMFRAQIGVERDTHLPMLAVIWQDERGAMLAETAVLVDFSRASYYKEIDGHRVPTYFRVHDPLLPSSPFSFQPQARMAVFVMDGSTLAPKLSAADFRPPPPTKR